jgi:hypothetical protein
MSSIAVTGSIGFTRGLPCKTGSLAIMAALAAWVPAPASAALVQLCGPTICYEYDNNPGVNAGITLFGAPTLLGGSDTLEFTPTSFDATATGAGGYENTVAIFQFSRIWTTNGAEVASITVTESGDYQILNGGTVSVNLRLQVVDKVNDDGLPSFPEVLNPIVNWNSSTPTGLIAQNWSLSSTVNPADAFTDLATVVDLQIQNTLQAFTSAPGEFATIFKKLTLTTTTVVPLPAAAWLFMPALGLLGFCRRRITGV